MSQNRRSQNWLSDDSPTNVPRSRRFSGGFVDLGNEQDFLPSSAQNEIFTTDVQSNKPWWRTNFFISQPVLFGTWDGVFTSCLINIFGVIVFMRSGWIVANTGIWMAVLLVILTVSIALISVLSAVGICERCRIESGGVYFLIAHTLGSRFGGSLGLLYCFGQSVGCSLNILGFGESMAGLLNLENNPWAVKGFAAGAVLLLSVINVAGVKWVVKLQFALLLVLLLSALDFMVGSFTGEAPEYGFDGWGTGNFANNWNSKFEVGITWFTVFGVFFPTITGILSGINMSGDLRAPSTDIPNGTLAAFSTATFLYLVFIIFLGSTVQRETLYTDFMITKRVSAIEFLLLAGIYVSSMSSCLGAMYGTPRVLQSIANENVVPGIGKLGEGRGPNKVPLYAMGVVAITTIFFTLIGNINELGPIVTMPFLFTYACIDYAYFALAQTFDIQTKREERFRIQAQSPLYETRNYGATNNDYHDNDLDHLFPERTRHKNLSSPPTTPYHQQAQPPPLQAPQQTQSTTAQTQPRPNNQQDDVIIRDGTNGPVNPENSVNSNNTNEEGNEDDEPIAPIRPPIHQKTKNWYSGFCNRWFSLFGAFIKIFIMMLVNWIFALICISVVFVIWFYVGTANPAVKPGIADEFRFFVWLKNALFRCFGKKVHDYEQVVITPHCNVDFSRAQLNDENEDFSSRRRYHQTAMVQGHYVDEI